MIMARAPVPGRVKTRLARSIGARRACSVHVALLETTIAAAMGVGVDVVLAATPDGHHHVFRRLQRRWPGLRLVRQGRGDLGQRMLGVFRRFNERPVILVGSDCPVFTPGVLRSALDALDHHRLVFVPAEDGGYVAVGGRRAPGTVFRGVSWGGSRVMAQTHGRVRAAGYSCRMMPMLWDVDERADWRRWIRGT